jgi:hypothetical protein
MSEKEPILDPFLIQLLEGYTLTEVAEIEKYMTEWDAATYSSVAQSILDHAARKQTDPLKYLRKAYNFNKRGAVRVPVIVLFKTVVVVAWKFVAWKLIELMDSKSVLIAFKLLPLSVE